MASKLIALIAGINAGEGASRASSIALGQAHRPARLLSNARRLRTPARPSQGGPECSVVSSSSSAGTRCQAPVTLSENDEAVDADRGGGGGGAGWPGVGQLRHVRGVLLLHLLLAVPRQRVGMRKW